MDDWKEASLQEVASFQEGPGILAKDFSDKGIPLVRLSGLGGYEVTLDGCNFVKPELGNRKWSHFRLKKGDILVSTSASFGRPTVVGNRAEGAIFYTGIIRFRSLSSYLNEKYLKLFLGSSDFMTQAEAMASGSVIRHFGPLHLREMRITLPPFTVQEAIADVVGTLDYKIELNRRTNETLESIARALFKDWFVDFGPTRAKAEGQAPYLAPEIWELFPDTLDDDDKPVGWINSRLGDFVELVYGKALKADIRKPGSIPVYGSNGQVGWHNVNLADGPGVIVGRKGNPGTANYVIEDFFCIDTTFYAKLKIPHWTYSFLWLLMEQLNLPGLAADSAVPGLNREIAYSAECVAPKSEVAVAFSETVEPLLTRIAHNKKESETLAQLRDLLLPKLMSGEIRLCDAERAVEAVL